MKPPLDLVVDGTMEDEVLLHLDLMKMAQLADPIKSSELVVHLYLKSMQAHYELT